MKRYTDAATNTIMIPYNTATATFELLEAGMGPFSEVATPDYLRKIQCITG
jgi:hypothetical protein